MINELSHLSDAIKKADIKTETWHSKYQTIPKIRPDAPCVRILLNDGKVVALNSVSMEKGKTLRKFGNNQGTFPAMNLAPLFRLTDKEEPAETVKKWIKADGVGIDIEKVRSWCTENNWSEKFTKKYQISICDRAAELKKAAGGAFPPLDRLIEATTLISKPEILHRQLFEHTLTMLKSDSAKLALQVLFYIAKPDKPDDYGSLSVIFDNRELELKGFSTLSDEFMRRVNSALMSDTNNGVDAVDSMIDAFGLPYIEANDTMPKIALPAGFDVTLRTMFSGQPCQYRYGKIESGSYPLSCEKKMEIKTALEWLAQEDNCGKTWVKTGKSEAFFAYPSLISSVENSHRYIQTFVGDSTPAKNAEGGQRMREADFIAVSTDFIEYISQTKKMDPNCVPEYIQLFAINKYDKARSRVAYSRRASPDEVIERSRIWQEAADNLPTLWNMKQPKILFPLAIAPVIDRIWNQDGTQASDKYRHTDRYHGVDLFFGIPKFVLAEDLGQLVRNSGNMAIHASAALHSRNTNSKDVVVFLGCLKETLSLMGMLLWGMGIKRSDYMNKYPYLLGQLLKISDAVHELYCMKVRKGAIPVQFVGSSMYSAAADHPLQTLALLGTRMQPYLAWCKANQSENVEWKDKDNNTHSGLSAGYYLRQYQMVADKLKDAFTGQTSFDETEKAQLFIGYLASYEKLPRAAQDSQNDEDGNDKTEGEHNHD